MNEAERRFEVAAHAASLGVWDWDLVTNTIFYSPRAKEICGFHPGSPVTYEQIVAVTHPEDLPHTQAIAARALDPAVRAHEPYRYRIVRAHTGETRWVFAHGHAIFDLDANPNRAVRYIGTLQDITEQKLAEDGLADSEARLRLAVEAGKLAVWELDLDANQITPSPELNLLCGFPADATPSLAEFRSRYAPGEAERIDREGEAIRARGETSIQSEFKQQWPDGTVKWLLLRAQVAPPSDRVKNRVIGILIDITDRKLAEERSQLIAREMQHRVKNTLAVVRSLAEQSFRGKADTETVRIALLGRLRAFEAATQFAIRSRDEDEDLMDLINAIVEPYRQPDVDPFVIEGPYQQIDGRPATAMALAVHELCTNAVKYGALSVAGGRVSITWQFTDGQLRLTWKEMGGPPVTAPNVRGFGATLLGRSLFAGPDDTVVHAFEPDGVRWEITVTLGDVVPDRTSHMVVAEGT